MVLRKVVFTPPASYPTRWKSLKKFLVDLYWGHTCYQLKTYLKAAGCKVGGVKEDLVVRLATHDADAIQAQWSDAA